MIVCGPLLEKICTSEEGTAFFEQLMKDNEIKAANFISSQLCTKSCSHSEIQDMPFIKTSGHSNKRNKAFYEMNTQKRSKSSFENNLRFTVVDSVPCKPKGRPKKIKDDEKMNQKLIAIVQHVFKFNSSVNNF